MMEFSHFQQLYVPKDFSTDSAPKTEDGKDIIQLHSEFTIRKMNGEAFTRNGQKNFPMGFHSDEELGAVINRSLLGSGHLGAFYPGEEPKKDHWLESMGDDTDATQDATILADMDALIESWTTVKAKSTTPVPPMPAPAITSPTPDTTEYSWMLGGKRIPLGFAHPPPLDLLPEREGPSTPSETVPNA
jgi:hypothetical protein